MAPRILSTLRYRAQTGWSQCVEVASDQRSGFGHVARIVGSAHRYDALILDASTGMSRDPLCAALVRRLPRGPLLLLLDATWKSGDAGVEATVRRAALRLLDGPRVHYGVLSTDEVRAFPARWGVDPRRVHFVPWYVALDPTEPAPDAGEAGPGSVFAGGDSLRDYAPLVQAARELPELRFDIAARGVAGVGDGAPLSANVHLGPVTHERFLELMERATVVVVPLEQRNDRSAGQQTYLRAMAMGKPTIVTDVFGVRDYIEHGETGLVVPPGDAGALRSAIAWATDPAHAAEVRALGERARSVQERFSPEVHVRTVLDIVEGSLEIERARS